MPPSGAALLPASLLHLGPDSHFGTEERFLGQKLGSIYQQYCRRVPRLVPRLAAEIYRQFRQSALGASCLEETYPVAITLCFALFAWRYNARILIRSACLSAYGFSLIVRALSKRAPAGACQRHLSRLRDRQGNGPDAASLTCYGGYRTDLSRRGG